MTDEPEKLPGRIRGWWAEYIENRQSATARALRARLRRAPPVEALCQREVFYLADRIGVRNAEALYRLARVLAEVEQDDKRTLAQILGAGDTPVLSELRFQRLIRAEGDDLTTSLVRAVRLADGKCNVASLGRDLVYWSNPDWSDKVRTRWAFHYFGAAAPEVPREATS